MFRHQQQHLPAAMIDAKDAAEVGQVDSLVEKVRQLRHDKLTESVVIGAIEGEPLRRGSVAVKGHHGHTVIDGIVDGGGERRDV